MGKSFQQWVLGKNNKKTMEISTMGLREEEQEKPWEFRPWIFTREEEQENVWRIWVWPTMGL